MQLLVTWGLVLVGTLKFQGAAGRRCGGWGTGSAGTQDAAARRLSSVDDGTWQHVIFGLSAGATFLIALEAYLASKSRWLKLRSSAGEYIYCLLEFLRCRRVADGT